MTTFAERTPCTSVHLSNTSRVKVDPGQTGFFEGREFRAFSEFSLTAAASIVYKLDCPVNMMLDDLNFLLTREEIRVEIVTGGTEGGTFTPIVTFAANGMSDVPAYTKQAVFSSGGTHTGGTIRDLVRVLAGANAANAAVVVIGIDMPVGRSAIPLYIRITNVSNGTAVGIVKLRWEERP